MASKLGTTDVYVARHQTYLPEGVQEQEDAVVLLQDVASDGLHGLARQDACHHVHGLLCQGRPGHLQSAWPSLHSPPFKGIPQPGAGYACPKQSSLGGKLDELVRHHDNGACLKTPGQALAPPQQFAQSQAALADVHPAASASGLHSAPGPPAFRCMHLSFYCASDIACLLCQYTLIDTTSE